MTRLKKEEGIKFGYIYDKVISDDCSQTSVVMLWGVLFKDSSLVRGN